jgi:LPS O-antigen subunit length determinant protein (WzzB/FepE family)
LEKTKKPSTQIDERELVKVLQEAITVILTLLCLGFIVGLIVYGVVNLCEVLFRNP